MRTKKAFKKQISIRKFITENNIMGSVKRTRRGETFIAFIRSRNTKEISIFEI